MDASVSDEEVEKEIESQLSRNARTIDVTDRAAQKGDTVVLDFDGSVDGVPFEGGKAEGYTLELGSNSFIPGFEDQLCGKNLEEDIDVNVTFPEDYHAEELAGKPALFKCKLHKISAKELPELDADFAEDQGFDSVDDYKADVKKNLEERKAASIKRSQEDEALGKIVADSKMDVPEKMIDTQVNQMLNEYAQNLAQSGLSFEQYMQFTGMTLDQLKAQMRPDATDRIKASLVLEAIAKAEGFEGTDEDVDAKLDEMAAQYGMPVDDLKKNIPDSEKENMKNEIALEKAINFVTENMKQRAKAKKKEEKKEEKKDEE